MGEAQRISVDQMWYSKEFSQIGFGKTGKTFRLKRRSFDFRLVNFGSSRGRELTKKMLFLLCQVLFMHWVFQWVFLNLDNSQIFDVGHEM